jgi:hypothetical protein
MFGADLHCFVLAELSMINGFCDSRMQMPT